MAQKEIVNGCSPENTVSLSSVSFNFNTSPAIVHMLITPKAHSNNKPVSPVEHTPKMMHQQDPNLFRLQRDENANSPSASQRVRAMRAMKSPNRAHVFDVPHDEQSIITKEERNQYALPSLSEILKDVIIYVEVRTGNDNRSEGVKSIIAKLGAQVNDRLLRNTTHVVFKDGLMSTYKRAQSWNIPIVSILWIEACKVQRRLCDPHQFPISNLHLYEHPELYGKMARLRCMQPDSELNKRSRKRHGTPTSIKEMENLDKHRLPAGGISTPTNVITDFYKPLSQKKHLGGSANFESPATQLLNRMNNGFFTPLRAVNKQLDASATKTTPIITDRREMGDVTNEKPAAQKSLDFNQDSGKEKSLQNSVTSEMNRISTPARTTRRSSSMHIPCTPELSKEKDQFEPRMTRRRSLLSLSKTMDVVENNSPRTPVNETTERKTRRRSSYQCDMSTSSLSEETSANVIRRRSTSSMSMDISTSKVLKKPSIHSIAEETLSNKTNYDNPEMEMSPSYSHIICKSKGRRTVYAAKTLEVSEYDENINPYMDKSWEANVQAQPSLDSFVTTKTSPDSFEDRTPVFSSTRLPKSSAFKDTNRRRSLFNVDLELAKERINQMNSNSQNQFLASANESELGQCLPFAPLQAVTTNVPADDKVTEPKMRRLFTPNDEVVVSPPKSAKQARKSSTTEIGTVSSSSKRRRTLAATPTPKPAVTVGSKLQNISTSNESQSNDNIKDSSSDTPIIKKPASKRQVIIKTLVHTNMHRDEVQNIHKAIRQLRGTRIDPTVTRRTTHLVSLEPRRTLNLLRGLMRGVWILNYNWILDSVKANRWLNEEKYELTSFSRSIEICRTERQAFGSSYRCELFRYMDTFYVSSLCRPITFNNIKELLLLGGAKLTENRYKAKYIIGDKRRADDDRYYLTANWVLDSITAMQVQKFSKYYMKSAIVTPYGIRYETPRDEAPNNSNMRRICYKDPTLVMEK